jgi:hypothetical protein
MAVVLNAPSNSLIHTLRRRYDPLTLALAPHITLVLPFMSELETEKIERRVRLPVRGEIAPP